MAYQPFDLTGKVALVTGGNRGIGLGMARALGQAGADLVIWGSNAQRNADAQQQLQADCPGVRVVQRQVDVSSEEQVAEGMAGAVQELGRVDAVFANAGIGGGGATPFVEMPYEEYRRILAVNLDGVFFTMREACKHMAQRAQDGDGGGSIVGVASLAAIEGAARAEHYAATKGAVISMVKAVAVEHARYGVRANAVLPGWIATDMTQGAQDNPKFTQNVIPRVPARRWGEPEDFGGVAVYLASDASAYHSGDLLVVDGGYSIF